MPTSVSIATDRACASSCVHRSCARITSVTCMPIVNTGFSDVIGSWKTMLMSLPRIARISSHESFSRSRPLKQNLAGDDPARRIGNEAQDAQRGDALARAGLADEAEHFALPDVEIDAVDGLGDAGLGVEVGAQTANRERACCERSNVPGATVVSMVRYRRREYSFGSKASRTASPMKTTSSSVTNSTPSG